MSRTGRAGERGMALLVVLWTLLLVGIVATSLSTEARKHGLLARNGMLLARAEAAADGGVMRAIAALQDPRPELRWRADGRPHRLTLDGITVVVRIVDEAGKVDVNAAPPDLIASLLRAVGASSEQAFRIASEINAIRTGRVGTRAGGFELPSDLLGLPDMSAALFERAEPYLTVFTRAPGIDLSVAQPALLAVLDGGNQDDGGAATAAASYGPAGHTLFDIDARAEVDRASFVRHAIVRLTHNVTMPYLIHQWSRVTAATCCAMRAVLP